MRAKTLRSKKDSLLSQMDLPFQDDFKFAFSLQGSHSLCVSAPMQVSELLHFYPVLANCHLYDVRPKGKTLFLNFGPLISLSRFYEKKACSPTLAVA
eukprot:COSAG05_NODE_6815_length_898_cov_1.103880_1_plen_97_part_00